VRSGCFKLKQSYQLRRQDRQWLRHIEANRYAHFVQRELSHSAVSPCLSCAGQGKFSYVFKAKQLSNNVMVALKLIKIFDMDNE